MVVGGLQQQGRALHLAAGCPVGLVMVAVDSEAAPAGETPHAPTSGRRPKQGAGTYPKSEFTKLIVGRQPIWP
jgi:hypothetical protein